MIITPINFSYSVSEELKLTTDRTPSDKAKKISEVINTVINLIQDQSVIKILDSFKNRALESIKKDPFELTFSEMSDLNNELESLRIMIQGIAEKELQLKIEYEEKKVKAQREPFDKGLTELSEQEQKEWATELGNSHYKLNTPHRYLLIKFDDGSIGKYYPVSSERLNFDPFCLKQMESIIKAIKEDINTWEIRSGGNSFFKCPTAEELYHQFEFACADTGGMGLYRDPSWKGSKGSRIAGFIVHGVNSDETGRQKQKLDTILSLLSRELLEDIFWDFSKRKFSFFSEQVIANALLPYIHFEDLDPRILDPILPLAVLHSDKELSRLWQAFPSAIKVSPPFQNLNYKTFGQILAGCRTETQKINVMQRLIKNGMNPTEMLSGILEHPTFPQKDIFEVIYDLLEAGAIKPHNFINFLCDNMGRNIGNVLSKLVFCNILINQEIDELTAHCDWMILDPNSVFVNQNKEHLIYAQEIRKEVLPKMLKDTVKKMKLEEVLPFPVELLNLVAQYTDLSVVVSSNHELQKELLDRCLVLSAAGSQTKKRKSTFEPDLKDPS